MIRYYAGIGSRETPPEVLKTMNEIGGEFAKQGWCLCSGNAIGADLAFERGARAENGLMQIWTANDVDWDKGQNALELAAKFHPAWDKCSGYAKKLHARNGFIILGADLSSPVEFVVCWTKDGKATGGTGQGLRIAEHYGIPVFNLFADPYGIRLSSWFRGLTNPDGSFIIQETMKEGN